MPSGSAAFFVVFEGVVCITSIIFALTAYYIILFILFAVCYLALFFERGTDTSRL